MEITPMKTHTAITVISLLALSTVATGMQSGRSETFVGKISSIDLKGSTLIVEDTSAGGSNPEKMTFKVDAQTKIHNALGMTKEEPSSLSLKDLKAGDSVNVSYVGTEGAYVARTIAVQGKPTS
jgi:hypothetical protein